MQVFELMSYVMTYHIECSSHGSLLPSRVLKASLP
jgi:hypothetical protein